MPLMLFCAVFAFSSCSSDGDDSTLNPVVEVDAYEVIGTTWEETHNSSSGTSWGTRVTFTSSEAVVKMETISGTETLTTTLHYTFQRSKQLVVLKPQETGNATLECRIDESAIKMTLVNMSNGSEIAVLYKK